MLPRARSALFAFVLAAGGACSGGGGGPSPTAGQGGGAAGSAAGADGLDASAAGTSDGAAGQGGTVGTCPARPEAGVLDGAADDGAADGGGALAACGACETAHASHDRCTPTLLTAMTTQDPNTGDDVPVGWGLATLPTETERAAGAALLHCLDVEACATDARNQCAGDNPVLGCFCGPDVTPEACISGAGVHGPCVAAYAAAAAATPGGPGASASMATLSFFVTSRAFDPSGPIGISDMINRCAIAAPCPVCLGL